MHKHPCIQTHMYSRQMHIHRGRDAHTDIYKSRHRVTESKIYTHAYTYTYRPTYTAIQRRKAQKNAHGNNIGTDTHRVSHTHGKHKQRKRHTH
jgi:hypothetical protein